MTANAMPEERERCLASGMDGFLAKPVRLDALRDALAAVTPRTAVWDLESLRQDFGGLAAIPAIVERFAAAMRADLDDVDTLGSPDEIAAWSHRVSGGLRVFGSTPTAAMLERFEADLRGDGANAALRRLPGVVAALRTYVARLVEAGKNLAES